METEFCIDVIEVPLQGDLGALLNTSVSLQSDVHIVWDVHCLIAENSVHPHSRCSKETTQFLNQ